MSLFKHKPTPPEAAKTPPDKSYQINEVAPAFRGKNFALVLSTDDNYADYLGVALTSIITNAKADNYYDIIIFDGGISEYKAYRLAMLAHNKSNISIRFFNIIDYTQAQNKLFYQSDHFTIAAFYRLFIPNICRQYERVLYLDCDVVADADVANLLDTDMRGCAIAAAVDSEEDIENTNLKRYLEQHLPFLNADTYFNSGVILFDIAKCLQINMMATALQKLAQYQNLQYPDQDILNMVLKGNVCFLSGEWNYMWGQRICTNRFSIPLNSTPKIIHFTSGHKPWNLSMTPLGEYFWKYARLSPFYEKILFQNVKQWTSVSPHKTAWLKFIKLLTFKTYRKRIKEQLKRNRNTYERLSSL